MPEPIIRVENLGKKYLIQHQEGRRGYRALRDVLTDGLKSAAGLLRGRWQGKRTWQQDFWALKDVRFDVQEGEVVGIIGRNGAGKSTLLKILSRITEPTTGRVKLNGRVASLLEVGTGFHPELTGRENVYLNGSILGMKRREIDRKFDEIVAFAEVETFLDTPVKRYSSGMYVRLAFAVAAHLEPEILVVDEVLAVGDGAFQKKCLGKMGEVAKAGRTVLFVSHNIGAIRSLCTTGLLLHGGRMVMVAPISQVVQQYAAGLSRQGPPVYVASGAVPVTPFFVRIEVCQPGSDAELMQIDQPIDVRMEIGVVGGGDLVATVLIRNSEGICIHHGTDEFAHVKAPKKAHRVCRIPAYGLAEGDYYLTTALGIRNEALFEKLDDVLHFRVEFAGRLQDRTTGNQWKSVCGPGLLTWDC